MTCALRSHHLAVPLPLPPLLLLPRLSRLFLQPLVPLQGESVQQLHRRYVEALLALGKQHGVQLSIAE